MSYLVMETHPAYAVVMDEEGRFLKAANLRYQVGDTVQEIIELQMPRKKAIPLWKPLSGLAGLAACFCLVFFGYYRPNFTAYGTLRIQINPDVEMTVSRTDRVLDLEGLNEDGEDLIAGYSYRGKDRETTAEELVERAIDMGYLSDGDTISITVNSSDPEWRAREEVQVQAQLEERYGESIVIQLGGSPQQPSPAPASGTEEVVIPVTPPTPAPTGEEAAPVSDPDRRRLVSHIGLAALRCVEIGKAVQQRVRGHAEHHAVDRLDDQALVVDIDHFDQRVPRGVIRLLRFSEVLFDLFPVGLGGRH